MPLKISGRLVAPFKSYGTFSRGHTDTQTHRRTDTQTHISYDPCTTMGGKIFFCLYVWGNSYTTVNCAKFLPFHFVKDDLTRGQFTVVMSSSQCTAWLTLNFWQSCDVINAFLFVYFFLSAQP